MSESAAKRYTDSLKGRRHVIYPKRHNKKGKLPQFQNTVKIIHKTSFNRFSNNRLVVSKGYFGSRLRFFVIIAPLSSVAIDQELESEGEKKPPPLPLYQAVLKPCPLPPAAD